MTSEIQAPNLDELSNGNGNHEASAPSSDSTTSDEKSSQSSLQEVSEPGTATSWTLFAQSYFQVKGSHTYLCSALQQPLLPKKDKADILVRVSMTFNVFRSLSYIHCSKPILNISCIYMYLVYHILKRNITNKLQ